MHLDMKFQGSLVISMEQVQEKDLAQVKNECHHLTKTRQMFLMAQILLINMVIISGKPKNIHLVYHDNKWKNYM